MNFSDRPFRSAGVIGVAMQVLLLVFIIIIPTKASQLPKGFFTPIIAFEFVETQGEVDAMFRGPDGTIQQEYLNRMDTANRLDFIYMVLYSMFLLFFSLIIARRLGKRVYYFAAALSVIVLLGDFWENLQLLQITAQISSAAGFDAELVRLHVFTWIKWGGIALIFLMLLPWFIKGTGFSKSVGLIGLVSFILGLSAFMYRSVLNELFALSVGLMFLLMVVYCFIYRESAQQRKPG